VTRQISLADDACQAVILVNDRNPPDQLARHFPAEADATYPLVASALRYQISGPLYVLLVRKTDAAVRLDERCVRHHYSMTVLLETTHLP
jgi:hypothetical protein